VDLVREPYGLLSHLLLLSLAQFAEGLLVVVNQQYVSHSLVSPGQSNE
jgi:hypothetical protein